MWPPTSSKFKAENNCIEDLLVKGLLLVTQISLTHCIALLVDIVSAAELFIFVSNISSAEQQSLHQVEQEEIKSQPGLVLVAVYTIVEEGYAGGMGVV